MATLPLKASPNTTPGLEVLHCYFFACFILSQFTNGSPMGGAAQSPPKVLPQDPDVKRVFPSGSNLQLPCGVEGDPSTFFFEWFKQNQPLMTAAGSLGSSGTEDRFRVTQDGSLKIKAAIPEDTGFYTCRAVNGFGTARVGITLIILAGDDDYEDPDKENPSNNLYPDREDDSGPSKGVPRTKPEFVQVSRFANSVIQRPVGSSIRFKCEGKAYPKPQLTWLRNGHPLSGPGSEPIGLHLRTLQGGSGDLVGATMDQGLVTQQLPPGAKKGRWTLQLQGLLVTDSGNYTCLLHNSVGSINTTFTIEVVDRIRQKPELTGDHPVNTTVDKGLTATLQCRVRSDVPPHIQWLKRVALNDLEGDENLIKVQGEFFRVLKSSEVLENPEGTFLNKLVITGVREQDAGKYVCLGANSLGYSFRSAYINVLHHNSRSHVSNETTLSFSSVPFPITVAIIVLGLVFLAGLTLLLRRYAIRRRRRRNRRHAPCGGGDQHLNPNYLHHSQNEPLQNTRGPYFGLEPSSNEFIGNSSVKGAFLKGSRREETIGGPATTHSSFRTNKSNAPTTAGGGHGSIYNTNSSKTSHKFQGVPSVVCL